jgi:hypothetical protein
MPRRQESHDRWELSLFHNPWLTKPVVSRVHVARRGESLLANRSLAPQTTLRAELGTLRRRFLAAGRSATKAAMFGTMVRPWAMRPVERDDGEVGQRLEQPRHRSQRCGCAGGWWHISARQQPQPGRTRRGPRAVPRDQKPTSVSLRRCCRRIPKAPRFTLSQGFGGIRRTGSVMGGSVVRGARVTVGWLFTSRLVAIDVGSARRSAKLACSPPLIHQLG